ncbi:hypothetical protein IE81DRAFT_319623 [Ceraceosorus guamensis]|uniref:Uncharacterized protein n=1 Tax=Ceraceosorus guamensis TaxID=1522189 RepID=A0A316WAP6_9BASI|nr:hypothetical protein IE81DRAFT_319623 [Ceraceosorus guamensis]PWN45791.1 hypothetical protein IE81DRAFT_319623 [Ceraceosorus guamensis]
MPPTPFAPSHQTPFKSSVSTAMSGARASARLRSDCESQVWPPAPGSIRAQDLDAREWSYLAEGGKNLLLRYCGESKKGEGWPFVRTGGREALALRVVKRERGSVQRGGEAATKVQQEQVQEQQEEEEIDAFGWREQVVAPLLHPGVGLGLGAGAGAGASASSSLAQRECSAHSLLPAMLEIQLPGHQQGTVSSFLAQVAARIELSRPASRRRVSGIDESANRVWAVQDLSWSDDDAERLDGAGAGAGAHPQAQARAPASLAVEIKPKWGALPLPLALAALSSHPESAKSAELKGRHSRYIMHRILKQRKQHTTTTTTTTASPSLSHHDAEPLMNNMYDPLLLYSDDAHQRQEALRRLVWEWRHGWVEVEGGAHEMSSTSASRKKSKKSNNLKFFVGDDGEVDVNSPADVARLTSAVSAFSGTPLADLKDASALDSALVQLLLPHTGTADHLCAPLKRLVHLQTNLDAHDVQGLAQRWKAETGNDVLGVLPSASHDAVAAAARQGDLVSAPTLQEYAALVQKIGHDERINSRLSLREAVLAYLLSASFKDCSLMLRLESQDTQIVQGAIKLIDLDPKPFGKLPHYQALDREIVENFAKWKAGAADVVEENNAVRTPERQDLRGSEWGLIAGRTWTSSATPTQDDQTTSYIEEVIKGTYAAILNDKSVLGVLKLLGEQVGRGITSRQSFALSLPSTPVELGRNTDPLVILAAGVAALHIYVRLNWTGPELDRGEEDLRPLGVLRSAAPNAFPPRQVDIPSGSDSDGDGDPGDMEGQLHDAALEALTRSGEPAYHLARQPAWLVIALLLIDAAKGPQSQAWWRLRAASIHVRSLDAPLPLEPALLRDLKPLRDLLARRAREDGKWAGLHARLILEHGLALQRAGNDRLAKELFVEAAAASGLRYEITGALGKRTFYQKEDRTQLVLLAESAKGREDEGVSGEGTSKDEIVTKEKPSEQRDGAPESGWKSSVDESQPKDMPASLLHNDDTFMERTKFTSSALAAGQDSAAEASSMLDTQDPNDPSPLSPLDACILLAFSLDLRNSSPSHGLVASQISAFVARTLSHARNWSVHTMALLLRSRLEAHRTRTAERGVLQLQALVDQMPSADSSTTERLLLFHSLDLPSAWEMRAELARLYAALGVIRSALEIFQKIELWEEVVACLGALGRQQEGIEVLHDLIQGRKVEADHFISERKAKRKTETHAATSELARRKINNARMAKLWCLLGDLQAEQAQTHYVRAWDVSQASSARAARSLGGLFFALGQHASASTWLKRALSIAPLFTRSWFMLGCAQMRLEKFADAAAAFRRAVALDEEDAESWNNLASCYLRMGSDEDAARLASAHDHAPDSVAVVDRATISTSEAESDGSQTLTDGLSSRGDSGVEVSDVDEDQEQMMMVGQSRARGTTPYELRLLAHRALAKAVRFSRDNWRVWDNYMMVSLDAGYLSEAARALTRVIELRTSSRDAGGKSAMLQVIDMKVLQRLVDAVTRAPAGAQSTDSEEYVRSPNEGPGLFPAVSDLFKNAILDRITPWPALWQTYARLLLWQGEYKSALEAHLSAWTTGQEGPGASDNSAVQTDKQTFVRAVEQLEELVELLENYAPRPAFNPTIRASLSAAADTQVSEEQEEQHHHQQQQQQQQRVAMPNWAFTARSLVRSFMGRTKSAFEDEPEWERLIALRDELKGKS